jgi:hypothetical protein
MMRTNSLDLTVLPKELKALLKIAQSNRADNSFIEKDYNWELFLDLAVHHRLFPGLTTKLNGLGGNEVPSFVFQRLQEWQQTNLFKMLHLAAEMEQLNQLFVGNKISCLFLKGPILGKVLYGDIALRTSSDLDVLVPITQLENVEMNLESMGYVKDDYIETILNDWKWRHHHLAFFHPEKKVKIEVHWRLNPGPGKEPPFSELWERKQELLLSSKPIYFLGNEDLFFFLVTHGARHGWSRLRWLVDIDLLIKKSLDWGRIHSLFKTYNHLPVAGQALILANQLLNTPIVEASQIIGLGPKALHCAQDALFYIKKMINLHSEPLSLDISRYHKRHLFSLMSFQQKSLFYLSFLFPYPEDAATLPLPKRLHYLYFLLRPFLWTWRKQKKIMTQGVKE